MYQDDITRRRRRRRSTRSGQEGLLQNDHLNVINYSSDAFITNVNAMHMPTSTTGVSVFGMQEQNRYQPPTAPGPSLPSPSPSVSPDHFLDHPTYYSQQQKLLYLTAAPQRPSIRRAIVSQTPARTVSYNVGNQLNVNVNQKQKNPAEDLGANSLFSYGCLCCQCVRTTEIGIVENFGKYEDLLDPGLHCLPWPLKDIAGRLSLRIHQMEIVCETKTLDSVFCNISLCIPFRIVAERAYDAFYRLTDPRAQIETYVFDVVRSTVPKMTLDEVFLSKNKIAHQVSQQLKDVMEDYGYQVFKTLVTDVRPAESVRQSMNEINASKRLKVAMVYLAEAEMIRIRKEAEAHAEYLYLQGVGISGKQKALVQEMKSCFNSGVGVVDGVGSGGDGGSGNKKKKKDPVISNEEIMNLLLITQYNDLLDAVSTAEKDDEKHVSNVIFKADPGQMTNLSNQIGLFRKK